MSKRRKTQWGNKRSRRRKMRRNLTKKKTIKYRDLERYGRHVNRLLPEAPLNRLKR